MAKITRWRCTLYAPQMGISGTNASTIPNALRCWTYSYYEDGNCSTNQKWLSAYSCEGHQPKRFIPDISSIEDTEGYGPDDPENYAFASQVNYLMELISAEIQERQNSPHYQEDFSSSVKSSCDTESTPINNISAAGITSLIDGYDPNADKGVFLDENLINALSQYIKSADQEELGNPPTDVNINYKRENNKDIISNQDMNTLARMYKIVASDCICYSDCNGYSVCYCYSNCNYY